MLLFIIIGLYIVIRLLIVYNKIIFKTLPKCKGKKNVTLDLQDERWRNSWNVRFPPPGGGEVRVLDPAQSEGPAWRRCICAAGRWRLDRRFNNGWRRETDGVGQKTLRPSLRSDACHTLVWFPSLADECRCTDLKILIPESRVWYSKFIITRLQICSGIVSPLSRRRLRFLRLLFTSLRQLTRTEWDSSRAVGGAWVGLCLCSRWIWIQPHVGSMFGGWCWSCWVRGSVRNCDPGIHWGNGEPLRQGIPP